MSVQQICDKELPFVPKTETFDCVALWEPAHAYVLVTVCGDDVRLIGREDERSQEGCVSQDECPARGVFVRRESVSFRMLRGHWRRCRQRCERIARGRI